MELYFEPMACSLATRISLYEAGATAEFHLVDLITKRLEDGSDFCAINAMGQVPVLRTDAGDLVTENLAILQCVADAYPQSGLAPREGVERYRLLQWLSFIASELHKAVFAPIFDPLHHEGAIEYAMTKVERRFSCLNAHLDGRDTLLEGFTVADAYLITLLNWTRHAGIDLKQWPNVRAYARRIRDRPHVGRAVSEELVLYDRERVRLGRDALWRTGSSRANAT
jgi:glutathione S-transferase